MKKKILRYIEFIIKKYHSLKPVKFSDVNLSDDKLFFITGYDKSGTSWMKKNFNCLKGFYCTGPNQYFDFFNSSPESNILRSLKINKDRSSSLNINKDSFKFFFQKSYKQKIKSLSEKSDFYGDKSTAQDVYLINYFFPNFKIFIIYRDPRDIIVSFAFHFEREYNKKVSQNSKFGEDNNIKTSFIKRETDKLKKYFNHLIEISEMDYDNVFIVKYEDLISKNGINYFHKVVNFVKGSDVNLSDVKSAWDMNTFEKQSRGRKPGEKDQTSFLRSGTAKDYLNHLTENQIKFIEKELSDQLNFFNYLD